MDKSLKEWAKENNLSYSSAYRKHRDGKIPEAYVHKGDIYVKSTESMVAVGSMTKGNKITGKVYTANATESPTRTNRAANNKPDNNYKNIDQLYTPTTNYTDSNYNNSCLSAKDMIRLTQKAYYGLGSVRRVVDILKDFSASDIYFSGGSAKTRKFFEAYFKTIGLNTFQNQFFLEYWRSSNCFIYKLKGNINGEGYRKLKQAAGSISVASSAKVPLKYVILNPSDIIFEGTAFFSDGVYYKVFNAYEVSRLLSPETDGEKLMAKNLPDDLKSKLSVTKSSRANLSFRIKLNKDDVKAIFNNKQDYEAFAVSMIYPVLDDLEHKLELKQMDRAIAKTCQQVVLHVAIGYENKAGEYYFSEEAAKAIEAIFSAGDAGKVLITDFTAKLSFIVPQIGELLNPAKYEVVDKDITEGLMDILFGASGSGEKFSNLSTKVKVFIEKINKSRQVFLDEFLIPEMEIIASTLGFKQVPVPKFKEIDIEDNINYYQVITRLAEVGLLTPEEVFQAFETGRLPTKDESIESQTEFKSQKDKDLYIPLLNQGKDDPAAAGAKPGAKTPAAPNGRPAGKTGIPQATKKPGKIGTGSYDFAEVAKIIKDRLEFKNSLAANIKKNNKIKELSLEQLSFVDDLAELVVLNEKPANWIQSAAKYLENSNLKTPQQEEIKNLAVENEVDLKTAAILYHANQ